jgi:hypothetical protein
VIIRQIGRFASVRSLARLFLSPSKKRGTAPPSIESHDRELDRGQLEALIVRQQTTIDEITLLPLTGKP